MQIINGLRLLHLCSFIGLETIQDQLPVTSNLCLAQLADTDKTIIFKTAIYLV